MAISLLDPDSALTRFRVDDLSSCGPSTSILVDDISMSCPKRLARIDARGSAGAMIGRSRGCYRLTQCWSLEHNAYKIAVEANDLLLHWSSIVIGRR